MGYAARHVKRTKIITKQERDKRARVSRAVMRSKPSKPTIPTPKLVHSPNPLHSGMWKGYRCFILGGGPSLRGFDYRLLKGEFTIGTNKTFMVFDPTINYSMDLRFYDWLRADNNDNSYDKGVMRTRWAEYKGIKVFPKPVRSFVFSDDISPINRIKERTISFDLQKGIYLGNNSGFGAMMLAVALGANPIYLLGMDMKVSGDKTHWHSGYATQPANKLAIRLSKQCKMFAKFASDLERNGIKVVNLGPDSAMDCFPKDTLENVIRTKKYVSAPFIETSRYPMIVSFYTKDTPYKAYADELMNSLKKLGLEYEIEGVTSAGSWLANTRYKPTLLEKMVRRYQDRGVLYVDCDALVLKKPDLFLDFASDFAVHQVDWSLYGRGRRMEVLGGTIYCRCTDRVLGILRRWIDSCKKAPLRIWEQRLLQRIIGNNFYNLPPEYCCIFDLMGEHLSDPVILHMQASRKLKRRV